MNRRRWSLLGTRAVSCGKPRNCPLVVAFVVLTRHCRKTRPPVRFPSGGEGRPARIIGWQALLTSVNGHPGGVGKDNSTVAAVRAKKKDLPLECRVEIAGSEIGEGDIGHRKKGLRRRQLDRRKLAFVLTRVDSEERNLHIE